MAATKTADKSAKKAPASATPWPLRPFVYAWDFMAGTLGGGLNGLAAGGRKGAFWGTIAAAAAFFVTAASGATLPILGGSLLAILGAGFVGGLVGGAAIGGIVSVVTGGAKKVGGDMKQDHDIEAKAHKKGAAADKAPSVQAEKAAKAERRAAAMADHAAANPKPAKPNHFQDAEDARRAAKSPEAQAAAR